MMKKCIVLILVLLIPTMALADLTVYFLDVGQGESTLFLCDGEAMIIDGGPPDASSYLYSLIRNSLHLTNLSLMIATHPHEDHIGGLPAVLNAVPVDLILSPVITWDTKRWENLKHYADEQGTPIIIPSDGDIYQLGGATVTILHCWPEAWDTNDMSIVTRVDYGEISIIVTGDAEYMSEYMMIDQGLDTATVLQLGHHGSHTSTTDEFLDTINPEVCIISSGAGNQYGHPHQEVLDRLKERKLFRTDLQGTVTLRSDGVNYYINTEKQASDDLYVAPHMIDSNLSVAK